MPQNNMEVSNPAQYKCDFKELKAADESITISQTLNISNPTMQSCKLTARRPNPSSTNQHYANLLLRGKCKNIVCKRVQNSEKQTNDNIT